MCQASKTTVGHLRPQQQYNVGRKQAVVKRHEAAGKGEACYRCAYSKRSKIWVTKEVKEDKKYNYVSEMQMKMLQMHQGDK